MKKKKQMPKKLLKKLKKKRAKRMRFDSAFIRLLNNLNTNIIKFPVCVGKFLTRLLRDKNKKI